MILKKLSKADSFQIWHFRSLEFTRCKEAEQSPKKHLKYFKDANSNVNVKYLKVSFAPNLSYPNLT